MPFMRRVLLSNTTYSSDAATQVLKLPRRGALSGLMVRARCTNGSTSGRAVSMLNVIDTVEVLANGDRPVISLNSDELLRWQRYWTRDFNHLIRDEQASAVQEWYAPLLFGRKFNDPQFWLPLDQFQDLELRIAYSPTIAADSGFATGTFALEVIGYIQDGSTPPSFGGFFRTLNKYNANSAASGDLSIELPRGKPYRAVMVYAHESGVAMHTDISNIKLELNDGAIVYLDGSTLDLVRENHYHMGLHPVSQYTAFSQNAETMETLLDYLQTVQFLSGDVATLATDDGEEIRLTSKTGGLITPQAFQHEATSTYTTTAALTTDFDRQVFATGIGLGKAVMIDFDDYITQGTPWNSDQFSKINLILTQAGADAQVRVSMSELVQGV